jgi:threonine aldolase
MPSGTMAQQIALRIWSGRANGAPVAFHPTAHPAVHEANALGMVFGLRTVHLGSPVDLITPADVSAVREPIAALLVELPQRELGARLPAWDDLQALLAAARERGMRLHLDGARLWEAAPFYRRSHAEIAGLFDSAYVSFYKGLDAIAGAALAGPEDFVAEARLWQHRLGGRLVSIFPLALSARAGMDEFLPHMRRYYERARALGARLGALAGVTVVPDPPQTNTFHIYLRGPLERLEERAAAIEAEGNLRIFRRLAPSVLPGVVKWEFVVGEATFDFSDAEIADIVTQLVAP